MNRGMVCLVAVVLCVAPGQLRAADCQKILQDIKLERHFFVKKEMIAKGIKQCPDSSMMNFKYGFSLERFNDNPGALSHYKRAAKLNRKFAAPYFGMGDIYLAQGKKSEAVTAYTKGLKIDPLNTRAIRSLLEAKGEL